MTEPSTPEFYNKQAVPGAKIAITFPDKHRVIADIEWERRRTADHSLASWVVKLPDGAQREIHPLAEGVIVLVEFNTPIEDGIPVTVERLDPTDR